MKIAKSVQLSCTPEEAFALRSTREFQEAKCVRSRALDHKVTITPAGGRTLIVTRRTMSTDGFPDAAKNLVGRELVINETQDWGPAEPDGSRSAVIALNIEGAPVALKGRMTMAPAPGGSVHRLEADLKASIPLLGGKVEKMAAPAIEAGLDIETQLLREWDNAQA